MSLAVEPVRLQNRILFENLSPDQIARLASIARPRLLAAGEVAVREREYGDALFVVERGRFRVLARGEDGAERVVATIDGDDRERARASGDFFGELCLLDLEPRCASVVAATEASVLEFPRDDLYWLFGDDKELQLRLLLAIARALSRRLRTLNVARTC